MLEGSGANSAATSCLLIAASIKAVAKPKNRELLPALRSNTKLIFTPYHVRNDGGLAAISHYLTAADRAGYILMPIFLVSPSFELGLNC